ncbi:hypothetical protein NECAME_19151 [Necator americanus]|uniref:SCP domain-containing protein n=1 Tax=Necator americanus TaxID=51031 RepID=W2ST46_NECAM|nr:hypothetical protein NECAME_19151 [Necator americanus]ETN71862.1 hypothetical protein NECAME_19151 [Necator americanus]
MQPAYINLLFLPLLLNSFYVFAGDICDGAQFAAFTNDERQALLDAHNNLRKNIADGKQDSKDGKLPSAKNMYQLVNS